MAIRVFVTPLSFVLATALVGCGDSAATTTGGGAGGVGGAGTGGAGSTGGAASCALTDATTPTATESPSGCAVLDRDTSACRAEREAQGLSGVWLRFSCRVTLTKEGASIRAESDGQPDHPSNYFEPTDPCHEDYTDATQNPNLIEPFALDVSFPETPDTGGGTMTGAIVGVAADGVAIFGNFAAPGDDIFQEAMTFDRCGGHPQMAGQYHYHAEPYALSYDDARFIGVLRDGYAVYGRRDADGSLPTLDADGGHMGTTEDSPDTPVYHYHLNLETSQTPGTAGQQEWFLTTGTYHGTPAACSSCQ
ncbi:MAG TPA: YHYH protein [Polyangiaceae bacterium]|nr:YHYH protein [Polyangiaceae bacterium]